MEEDIDGETVVLLQQNDIAQIFPRIKDRVKFIDLRAKLIVNFNEQAENNDTATNNLFDLTSSSSSRLDSIEENDTPGVSFSNKNREPHNLIDPIANPNLSSINNCPDDNDDICTESRLPADYEGPDLTMRMQQYVDDNNLSKFNPHTAMRSELLSLVFDDVSKSHELLYPTNDEYTMMAKCLVKKLRVPSTLFHQAVKDWHESIKQKFKRERKPLQMSNNFVKDRQDRYGNGKTNGRPKKKSMLLQAERRNNDIPLVNLTDQENENLLSLVDQMRTELLKDDPDHNVLRSLWRQSFNIRRLCIRELTVTEILDRFPGYRLSEMILTEVKESAGVNIDENVNDLLPKFFDSVPDNNCFLSDVLPIRIIRVLCKFFGDSVGNMFTYEDVLVPYPCIKVLDDKFELYLDYCLITETTSCFTALALLLSLYYVFEIRFGSHNRCCRLLYGVLFEDTHHLNKALKTLLNKWKYKIVNRPFMKRQAVMTSLIENFTQPTSTVNKNISSSSIDPNETFDASFDQSQQDQCSSSSLNITTSANLDQQSVNQQNDDDMNQALGSDDKENLNSLSIASPVSMSRCNSPMMFQNETTSPFTTGKHSNNTNSPITNTITPCTKSSSAKQLEDEPHISKEGKPRRSAAKRKIEQCQSLSTSVPTTKQSSRLAAKRVRLQ